MDVRTYCVETGDGVCLGYYVAHRADSAKLLALDEHGLHERLLAAGTDRLQIRMDRLRATEVR
jgi:hypothetical protein